MFLKKKNAEMEHTMQPETFKGRDAAANFNILCGKYMPWQSP